MADHKYAVKISVVISKHPLVKTQQGMQAGAAVEQTTKEVARAGYNLQETINEATQTVAEWFAREIDAAGGGTGIVDPQGSVQ